MTDLKTKLSGHFESKSLNSGQLDSLTKLSQDRPSYRQWFYILLPVAAAIGLMIFIPTGSLQERIIGEVGKNHIKDMPMEVASSDLRVIAKALNKLDFALISAKITKNLKLIGGRYCSVQGVTAAQLKFEDRNGKIYTVYQVPPLKSLPEQTGLQFKGIHRGVQVSVYLEKGLVIAIAVDEDKDRGLNQGGPHN